MNIIGTLWLVEHSKNHGRCSFYIPCAQHQPPAAPPLHPSAFCKRAFFFISQKTAQVLLSIGSIDIERPVKYFVAQFCTIFKTIANDAFTIINSKLVLLKFLPIFPISNWVDRKKYTFITRKSIFGFVHKNVRGTAIAHCLGAKSLWP